MKMYRLLMKRPLDFFCAIGSLVILSPVFLIFAVLGKINTGAVFYKQHRVGKGGKVFVLYKFQSMTNKKDEYGNLLPDKMRLHKYGKFIRATSIDELPQLFNIIKGNMSFIGPRPKDVKEAVFHVDKQFKRYDVRPGITGLAQVSDRNNITFDVQSVYDNKYAMRVTFWGDFLIILKTIAVVFCKKGIDRSAQKPAMDDFHVGGNYWGDVLLSQGAITKLEYDKRVAFSKTLKVGDIMPSLDKQRQMESAGTLTVAASVLGKGLERVAVEVSSSGADNDKT